MYLNRLINITIALLIILMSFIAIPVNADEDIENKVEAEFNIEFKSATDLKIIITSDVSKIYLEALETSYTGGEIASIANTNPSRMSIIKYALKGMMKNQIKQTFGNVTVTDDLPAYENDLFYDEFDVNLTSAFFGMNETVNAHDFINGVLDMDAVISYSFNLQAEPGWNNTYCIMIMLTQGRKVGMKLNGR